MLANVGARPHYNSGAGREKYDGSDEDYVYEVKDANESFVLSGRFLRDLFVNAVRRKKLPMLLVYFTKYDFTASITITPGGKELCNSTSSRTRTPRRSSMRAS